ncbi:hypothetical protein [Gynuella sp.]|uniref:hypothetical protein n=1 Tax=Gynuella sp. TaxID=2969146 RepID=UPI003D0E48F5
MLAQKPSETEPPAAEQQKTAPTTAPATPSTSINNHQAYEGPEGSVSAKRLTVNTIHFPAIAAKEAKTGSHDIEIRRSDAPRKTGQIAVWQQMTQGGSGLGRKLDNKLQSRRAWHTGSEEDPIYFLSVAPKNEQFVIGNRDTLIKRIIRPYWTPKGNTQLYDVDHKKEYQLGGDDKKPDEDNLWLLDSSTNRSAGARINNAINKGIGSVLEPWNNPNKPDVDSVRKTYSVTLKNIIWDAPFKGNSENYTAADIAERATQLEPLKAMSRSDVKKAGLQPGKGEFLIFNNASGGRSRTIELAGSADKTVPFTDTSFIAGFKPHTAIFNDKDEDPIKIVGVLWPDNPALKSAGVETSFSISPMPGLAQTGYLNFGQAERQIQKIFKKNLEVEALSPLTLSSVTLDENNNLIIKGKVVTNLPLLRGADIDFTITGNELSIEKTFASQEVSVPAPFHLNKSSLTLALSTSKGLSANGEVNFAIDRVGSGKVSATADTTGSLALAGTFKMDEQLFGKSEIAVGYQQGQWYLNGTTEIAEGKIPGVSHAQATVGYHQNEGLSIAGKADLNLPGIDQSSLDIGYNSRTGLYMRGTASTGKTIPGIDNAELKVDVAERRNEPGFKISASGAVQARIAGVNAKFTVSYDDGAFTAEGSGQYKRGLFSGQLHAGVTNRGIDPKTGNLLNTPATDGKFKIFGGGRLSMKLTPWLQGMVGVQLQPSGDILADGQLSLANPVTLFERKAFNRKLFGVAVQVPIVPLIVAEVGANLKATASIGPGQITKLQLGVRYHSARPNNTKVSGDAEVKIPADAGIRLAARAGVGVGGGLASATGGIELGGMAGLTGVAKAEASTSWTPAKGLIMDMKMGLHASPKFVFDISGYINAQLLGADLYDNTWQFASYSFGPDYRFGVSLPIHYEQGKPFKMSVSDLQFEVPPINAKKLMRDLIEDIV